MRPMWAGRSAASAADASYVFVSKSCVDSGTAASYNLRKTPYAVKNTREIGKKDMKLNSCLPAIKVDPETYRVTADGEVLTCKVAEELPLGRFHFLF